jgi:hypothetical protein
MRQLFTVMALIVLSGCGPPRPRAVFESGWAAAKSGDRAGVVACYTQATQDGFKEIEEARSSLGDLPNIPTSLVDVLIDQAQKGTHRVVAETIDGDRATLQVLINEKSQVVRFLKEGKAWKIDANEDVQKLLKAISFVQKLQDRPQAKP